MEKLRAQRLHTTQISDAQKHQMYELFEGYYKDVSYEGFCSDLAEKNCVLCFFAEQGLTSRLIGFSTQMQRTHTLPTGHRVKYLFSGDTVMHHEYWGSKILQTSFFWFIVAEKFKSPFAPVYWMLMSKGYKTYLMMRRNFKNSYPSPFSEKNSKVKLAMDTFYTEKFGEFYCAKSGVIEFDVSHGAVKDAIAEPPLHVRKNPEIGFFLARNPEYSKGTELACIAEIRFSDFPLHIVKYFFRPLLKFTQRQKLVGAKTV